MCSSLFLFLPFYFFTLLPSIVALRLLVNILVEQGSPVHYQQSMWVVVSSRHSFQLSCRHQFTGQHIGSTLDALSAVVGELHLLLVELDTVTEDAEHGTCSHDVGVETLFFQRIVLLEQIRTIDKKRLKDRMGELDLTSMNKVNTALSISFGLGIQ